MVSEGPFDAMPLRARNAHVATDSTLPSREPASARRWTKAELDARVAAAPPYAYDPPSAELLLRLAASYHELTGQLIRTHGQRNLLASGYRMHGPAFVPFLSAVYAAQGSTVNLLGIVRCAQRRDEPGHDDVPASRSETDAGVFRPAVIEPGGHDGPPCPIHVCLQALIYCDDHRPPFDPNSTRRYDRPAPGPTASAADARPVPLAASGGGAGR
jgi:hypothetical protein